MKLCEFDEYVKYTEPHKRVKGEAWQVAIGLQAVDGLVPSSYLLDTARKDIEGEITLAEAEVLMKTYYQSKDMRTPEDEQEHEADMASVNIRKLLAEPTCAFTYAGLLSVHRRIFTGIYKFAGQIRTYNITKKEWVLRGDTVLYVSAPDLKSAIEYDLEKEKNFDYTYLHKDQMIERIVDFVSGLWQIHPFGEGNTRTTAVFTILYLRSLGFDVDNDLFAYESWYFRNALVRANYQNVKKGIACDKSYLIRFFRNLLLGEENELKNRTMLVNAPDEFKYRDMPQNVTPQVKGDTPQADVKTLQVTPQVKGNTPQVGVKTPQVPPQAEENTPQADAETPQVTPQAKGIYPSSKPKVVELIKVVGRKELSTKEMMALLNLKDRKNFVQLYLIPALESNYLRYLYPDKPKHPRQKYLLTIKGLMIFDELEK